MAESNYDYFIRTGKVQPKPSIIPTSYGDEHRQPRTTPQPTSYGDEHRQPITTSTSNINSNGGGSGGGGGSIGSTASPSGPTPWSVATKNGLTGNDTVPGLNHALTNFNKSNGTNYQLNSSGHIRQNGSGAYMSQSESNSFIGSIPTNAVDYKYGIAIDKAIAGDLTEMKNLDRFFTGAERPAIGYTKDWLVKEKEAKSLGISMEELDIRNKAPVAAPVTPVATVEPTVAASAPTPPDNSSSDANPTVTHENNEKVSVVGDFNSTKEDKSSPGPSSVNLEENPAKAMNSVAIAARKSAIESRLQKIAAQRQPYGGTAGATSIVKDSGVLVPPPIAGGGASQNGLPTLP